MALPIRCLTGSTSLALAPNMRRVSEIVVPSCKRAACTFLRLAASQFGDFERAGAFLAEPDRILQGVDLPDILLVREIDQETDDGNSIARANHLPGKSVSARAVIGGRGVLILIDDLHPHVALARLRQRDRHPPGIEVDNRKRIQRVAVGTDNALLDGRSELAAMSEFSETTVLDHPGETNIGLGAVVVLDGDGLSR